MVDITKPVKFNRETMEIENVQVCPQCKTEHIKHETKEDTEYAICLECGWKFDIDYSIPY